MQIAYCSSRIPTIALQQTEHFNRPLEVTSTGQLRQTRSRFHLEKCNFFHAYPPSEQLVHGRGNEPSRVPLEVGFEEDCETAARPSRPLKSPCHRRMAATLRRRLFQQRREVGMAVEAFGLAQPTAAAHPGGWLPGVHLGGLAEPNLLGGLYWMADGSRMGCTAHHRRRDQPQHDEVFGGTATALPEEHLP